MSAEPSERRPNATSQSQLTVSAEQSSPVATPEGPKEVDASSMRQTLHWLPSNASDELNATHMRQTLHWLPSRMADYPRLSVWSLPAATTESPPTEAEQTIESMLGGRQAVVIHGVAPRSRVAQIETDPSTIDTVRSAVSTPATSTRVTSTQVTSTQVTSTHAISTHATARPDLALSTTASARGMQSELALPAPAEIVATTPSGPTDVDQPRRGIIRRVDGQVQALRTLAVSTYRFVGFVILTVVVLGLASYLAAGLFYFVNRSWVKPTVIDPTDQRVLELSSRYAEQSSIRDRLHTDLAQAERVIEAERAFQRRFKGAIEADIKDRKDRLRRLSALSQAYAQANTEVSTAGNAYSSLSDQRMKEALSVGMMNRDSLLAGKLQLAQIRKTNLAVAQEQFELERQARDLAQQARALDAALSNNSKELPRYDVLQIMQQYQQSLLSMARAQDEQRTLKQSIARYDQMLEGINQSPYLRASQGHGTIAFVPYTNLPVQPGQGVFACKFKMFWCQNVGDVISVLPGEVSDKHPYSNDMLRGQMIELRIKERRWAEQPALFVGRAPLFI